MAITEIVNEIQEQIDELHSFITADTADIEQKQQRITEYTSRIEQLENLKVQAQTIADDRQVFVVHSGSTSV